MKVNFSAKRRGNFGFGIVDGSVGFEGVGLLRLAEEMGVWRGERGSIEKEIGRQRVKIFLICR